MVYFFAMLKYIFWIVVVTLATLLSFEQTYRIAIPIAFVFCMLYTRWMNGALVTLTKFMSDKFDKFTDATNEHVKMTNEHSKIIKRLVLNEKEVPQLERKIDRVEKESNRTKEMVNKK